MAINQDTKVVPTIFYVSTNNENIVRTWIEYGGNGNAVEPGTQLPLLALAILNVETIRMDTAAIARALLSYGVDASATPRAFYSPYLRDLSVPGPDAAELWDMGD